VNDASWRLVAALARPHRRQLAGYGAVLAIATALPLAGSWLLAQFVRLAVSGAGAGQLGGYALAYSLLGLAGSVVTVVVTWRATTLAWRITDGLRHQLADLVLRADLAFHRDRTPGELVTRIDADVTAMTQFLSQVVARVVAIVVLGVATVVVLAVAVPLLAPALAVGLTAVGCTTWFQRNRATAATAEERKAEADVMSAAEQYLSGADDVVTMGAGAHAVGRVAERAATMVRAIGRRVDVQMRVQGWIRVAIVGAEAAMIGVGALLAGRGRVDIGDVFLGYRFVAVLRRPIESLTWRLQDAQGASGAARRVLELLASRNEVASGGADPPPGPLELRFEHVGLVYDDEPQGASAEGFDAATSAPAALRDVDLVVPAGRCLGLVGRTGSGKTSLARLALRLVAPTSGRVTLGGVDLADVDDDSFRRRVGAVPQDVQLLWGTVGENVNLFAGVEPDRTIAALDAVGLGPWLAQLPAGLDTPLGASESAGRDATAAASEPDGGGGMSAGQAQLLALARTVLRAPDLVVLDEATSRVDPRTQTAITEAMRTLVRGRTALVVAHRLDTLDVCDDIAVIEDGRVLEHGSRAQLAADPTSHYARLRAGEARATGADAAVRS